MAFGISISIKWIYLESLVCQDIVYAMLLRATRHTIRFRKVLLLFSKEKKQNGVFGINIEATNKITFWNTTTLARNLPRSCQVNITKFSKKSIYSEYCLMHSQNKRQWFKMHFVTHHICLFVCLFMETINHFCHLDINLKVFMSLQL